MMRIPSEYLGNPCYEAKICDCRNERIYQKRYEEVCANTPAEYTFLINGLDSLRAENSRHPKQSQIIEKIKEKPSESYSFFGLSGCGKSVISWAIAQTAARNGKKVYAGTADTLILSFITKQIHGRKLDKVELNSIEQLTIGDKWLIFIDEIEKVKLSDYTLRTLFSIIKTSIENGHQLVITANRTLEEVEERWIKLDRDGTLDAENYASAIRRRLNEYCIPVDMRLFECENGHHSAVGRSRECLVCEGKFEKWLR